ncbi:MAG TPA: MFS transporter [Bryobacteraceae bacterium]|nr:MFS transporter [Bryobacteraceae bacterium]
MEKPTRARHLVIVFAVCLAIITYIDRVCISQAAPYIQKELGFSRVQMGYVFAAFALAYALFEIPGGWMGDWLGPRRVLLRVVVWWSVCMAAMGWMWNLVSMTITNFLFGAGEAGCFPNLTKAFTTWLPQHERVRAQGIMWMSARWGGAVTPMLVLGLLHYVNWRQAFQIFGVLGVVWAVLFYRWFRDNPRDHKSVNKAELAMLEGANRAASGHGDVPWRKLLARRSVWLLWVQYFCLSYTFWFFVTWLPTYLREYRQVSEAAAARLSVFPLFFGGIGCITAGMIAARVARLFGSVRTGRRVTAAFGCLGAATLMFLHTGIQDPLGAMIVMGLASFCNDLVMPSAWGACMDIGGKYAGTLSGSMNMMGNLAGGVAPIAAGYILAATGNWLIPIYVMAAIYLVGVLCWLAIDPVTPLEQ